MQKLNKAMSGKKHQAAEAEEMDMMDEPKPKPTEQGAKKGAMDDEFDLMGGAKPKEEPSKDEAVQTKEETTQPKEEAGELPPDASNLGTGAEDQAIKKKKKKHHKKRKDTSLVQEATESMSFAQRVKILMKNDSLDNTKKIQDFTEKICMPQLIAMPELKDDRDMIPYICFYDGLSLLKSTDEVQPEELISGFQQKKSFLKNHQDCEATLKSEFAKPGLDSLMPAQDKYQDNKYLDIYTHFCKKEKKGMSLT
jgi:hypothetical protein